MFFTDEILALLGSGVGVFFQEFIGGTKGDLLGKERLEAKLFGHLLVSVVDGLINFLDRILQGIDVAILLVDDLLPIPLIDVAVE